MRERTPDQLVGCFVPRANADVPIADEECARGRPPEAVDFVESGAFRLDEEFRLGSIVLGGGGLLGLRFGLCNLGFGRRNAGRIA